MADLDKLNIVIEGESTKAVSALDKLVNKLREVKQAMSDLGASGSIRISIREYSSSAKEMEEAARRQKSIFTEAKRTVTQYYNTLAKYARTDNDVFLNNGHYFSESGVWDDLAHKLNVVTDAYSDLVYAKEDISDTQAAQLANHEKEAYMNYAVVVDQVAAKLPVISASIRNTSDSLNGMATEEGRIVKGTEEVGAVSESASNSLERLNQSAQNQKQIFSDAKHTIKQYYDALTKLARTNNDITQKDGKFFSGSGHWSNLASELNWAKSAYENLKYAKEDVSEQQNAELYDYEQETLRKYGVTLDEVAEKTRKLAENSANKRLKELSKAVKETGNSFSLANTKLGKLLHTIKRVAMMRMIRWALRQVVKAAKEGLDILTEWDRAYGNNTSYAAKTVDELAAKWRQVEKAVGAAIMPLVQILQPVLNGIMDFVITLANGFNQILRSAQGFGTYMKATYINTKKTSDSAKELRRVLFGFDELNVLNGNGGTGTSISVSPIEFKETGIESQFKKLGERLIQIWDKVKSNLSGVIDAIKIMLGGLFEILEGFVEGDLHKIWEGIKKTVKGLLDSIRELIKGFLNLAVELLRPIINWVKENVIDPISKAFNEAIEAIRTAFNTAWTWVKENIIQPVVDFFDGIFSWIDEHIVTPIKNAIKKVNDWFREHPAIAKFLGIEPVEDVNFDIDINIDTHTNLSGDTKKLYDLVSIAKGGGTVNVGSSSMNISLSSLAKNRVSTMFASGGDPDMGSLFWAGESGAEIVANTPSGTGVMNMRQMQDAVSNGNVQVVNAIGAMTNIISRAIAEKDTNAYLDGQKITDTVIRRANSISKATGQAVLSY